MILKKNGENAGTEFENYGCLYKDIVNPVLKGRVESSFHYYVEKANLYKKIGMALSISGIILPASATFLTACNVHNGVIAFFTALSTIASGMLAYLKCSEKQASYRNLVENMKAELTAYAIAKGAYSGAEDQEERDNILFEHIEKIIQEGYR